MKKYLIAIALTAGSAAASELSITATLQATNCQFGHSPEARVAYDQIPGTVYYSTELADYVYSPILMTGATQVDQRTTPVGQGLYGFGRYSLLYPESCGAHAPIEGGMRTTVDMRLTLDGSCPSFPSTNDLQLLSFTLFPAITNQVGVAYSISWLFNSWTNCFGGYYQIGILWDEQQQRVDDLFYVDYKSKEIKAKGFESMKFNYSPGSIIKLNALATTNNYGNWGWIYTNNGGALEYRSNWVLATAFQIPTNGAVEINMTNWALPTDRGFFLIETTNAP
jgi:hypothetical protein